MCEHLTKDNKCTIKDIETNTEQTLKIMNEYKRITNKNALSNNECQYSYEGITEQCPCNR